MQNLQYAQNQLQTHLPIEVFANAMGAYAKLHPKTKMEQAPQLLFYWHTVQGKGTLILERPGEPAQTLEMPHQNGKSRKAEGLLIELPCVLRLKPEEGDGMTVNMTANGAFTHTEGSLADPLPVLPDPENATPLEKAARAWLRDGAIGSSSYALCVGLTGVEDPQRDPPADTDVPWDAADFRRCQGFFDAVPEARPLIAEMAQHGPYWAAIAPVWDDLEQLYAQNEYSALHDRIHAATDGIRQRSRPRP